MSKPFAVFDIDGTLFRWQLFHEVVFELAREGILPAGTEEKLLDAQNRWRNREHKQIYHDYERLVFECIATNLAGISVEAFTHASARIVERAGNQLYAYTRDLMKDLKQRGYTILAISGSFDEIVKPFAQIHGIDDWRAATCLQQDGCYTGEANWMASPHNNRKLQSLQEMVKAHGLSFHGSVGVGDTAGDIPFLEVVDQPIVFNPSAELFAEARKRHWPIVVERKNVVYHLQPHHQTYQLQSP